LFVEFASVVDAERCAVESQLAVRTRPSRRSGASVPHGINLGDIIKDGRDIHGDGVNIAAQPGEVCVSRVVRDQVRDKVDFAFEDADERQVKNIADGAHPTVPEIIISSSRMWGTSISRCTAGYRPPCRRALRRRRMAGGLCSSFGASCTSSTSSRRGW
jgi:hypothetical protein